MENSNNDWKNQAENNRKNQNSEITSGNQAKINRKIKIAKKALIITLSVVEGGGIIFYILDYFIDPYWFSWFAVISYFIVATLIVVLPFLYYILSLNDPLKKIRREYEEKRGPWDNVNSDPWLRRI